MKKKMLSLALVLVMCIFLCIPAYAETNAADLEGLGYSIIPVSDKVSLAEKRTDNGDIYYYTIFDGVIVSETVYKKSEKKVITTDVPLLPGETPNQTVVDLSTQISESIGDISERTVPTRADGPITLGSITYEYYIQGAPFTRTLNISYYSYLSYPDTLDINGNFRDFGQLVATLAAAFTITSSTAKEIAEEILDKLGFGLDFVDVFFPSIEVDVDKQVIDWYAKFGSVTGSFSGAKCTATQTGYAGKVYYDGNYYTATSFFNENATLARLLHDCINVYWGDGPYEVVSWN